MKGMGKGVKMFKQGMNEVEEEVKRPLEDQPSQQPTEQQPNQDGK
jgi:Sec-independent protein translocase protein TatA